MTKRPNWRTHVVLAAGLFLLGQQVRAQVVDPPAARLVEKIVAGGDFIDDPFALSDDGHSLAYVTTDGATRAEVHLRAIDEGSPFGKKGTELSFKYPSITPERVEFLDAERVLVVERNGTSKLARAMVYGKKGAAKETLGPATGIGLGDVAGAPAIVAWLKTPGEKGTTHSWSAMRRDNLKPLPKKVLVENADGRISMGGSLWKVQWFQEGYAVIVGLKEGDYDKAKDVRRPDVEASVEVWTGKVLAQREIGDVIAFAQLALVRRKHDNERHMVRYADDLSQLLLTDDKDETIELKAARPMRKYDPQTLAVQASRGAGAGPGVVILSLTVDPVHAEAVKAQKADTDFLDLYRLDVPARTLTQIARVDGQKRATRWMLSGNRLALMRKHKGFGRGGEALEILDIGEAQRPTPPAGKAPAAAAPAR